MQRISVTRRQFLRRRRERAGGGFTLIELLVVVAVISLLIVISFPAVSAMWSDGAQTDAENRLHGMLRSARMRAANKKETGVFFYVEDGVQKGVFIEAYGPQPIDTTGDGVPDVFDIKAQAAADRFRVLQDTRFTLPVPMRLCPLDVLDESVWNDDELAHEEFPNEPVNASGVENQRNFFTMIFSPDGQLVVGRNVLIYDERDPKLSERPPGPGTLTGLEVGDCDRFQEVGSNGPQSFVGVRNVPNLVSRGGDRDRTALTFPSVAGLLMYDDSLLEAVPVTDNSQPDVEEKREFLKRTGRPLYVIRSSGKVVRGPLIEAESS